MKGILKTPTSASDKTAGALSDGAADSEGSGIRGRPQQADSASIGRSSRKLQWDEEALRQNALVLEQLEHAHPVVEPKTPFARCSESPERQPMRSGDHDSDVGGEDNGPDGNGPNEADKKKRPRRSSSWSTSSEDDSQPSLSPHAAEHKHDSEEERRFREHRAQHYRMRNALHRGKQLLVSESELELGGPVLGCGDSDLDSSQPASALDSSQPASALDSSQPASALD